MIPTKTGILSCDISDHFPIFCIFNDLPMNVDKPTITKRRLNKESIKKFNKALQFINWHFINDYDIQTAFTMFQGVIDLLFDEFCPKQTFTMTYSNKLPWLTDALRKSIKIKNCLYAETKANPNDQQLKRKYKRYRNQVFPTYGMLKFDISAMKLMLTFLIQIKLGKSLEQLLA